MQYLPLLSPERVDGIVSVAGCPASAKELPEELIVDWVARAGDREKLREIPMMFAVKPDLTLVDEWADDAVKASRYALEATLRMLLTSFEEQIAHRVPGDTDHGFGRQGGRAARSSRAKGDRRALSGEPGRRV